MTAVNDLAARAGGEFFDGLGRPAQGFQAIEFGAGEPADVDRRHGDTHCRHLQVHAGRLRGAATPPPR